MAGKRQAQALKAAFSAGFFVEKAPQQLISQAGGKRRGKRRGFPAEGPGPKPDLGKSVDRQGLEMDADFEPLGPQILYEEPNFQIILHNQGFFRAGCN